MYHNHISYHRHIDKEKQFPKYKISKKFLIIREMIITIRVNYKLLLRSKTKSSSLPTPEYLSYTRIWRAHTGVMTEGVDIVLARGGV